MQVRGTDATSVDTSETSESKYKEGCSGREQDSNERVRRTEDPTLNRSDGVRSD